MKKVAIWLVMAIIVTMSAPRAEAFFGKKKQPQAETATPALKAGDKRAPKASEQKKQPEQKKEAEVKKIDPAQQKSLEAKRALVAQMRKRLDNTEWQVELRPLAGSSSTKEKEKRESDSIFFKDNQVVIGSFEKKNFSPTNFTLTVQDDGIIVWETMQASEKSGTAFWRGEIDGQMQKMQGILSYHLDEKTIRDYSFVSMSKGAIVPVATGN